MSEVTIITFVIEALIIAWAFHRSGFMPFPHIFMIYIVGAQLFMWLNAKRIIYYDFLDVISTDAYIIHFDKMFLLLFLFFLGAAACTPKARLDIGAIINSLELDFRLLVAIIAFLYIRLFAHLAYLDLSSLWFTDTYVEMGQVLVRDDSLGTFLSQSARAFGLLAVSLAAYLFGKQRWLAFLAILPLASWHVMFDLAAHSRQTVSYFVAAGLILMTLRRGRLAAPAAMFFAGFIALLGSIAGRSSAHHGFSSLPFYFANILDRPLDFGELTNIFEGAFVTAEYFSQTFVYNWSYKILSMSPLISAIDGYEAIRLKYEIRIHRYAPNSAISEVLSFGPGFYVAYFSIEFLACWSSARLLAKKKTFIALFINSVVLLAMYLQFTYTTRWVFRYFVLALLSSAYLLFRSERRSDVSQASATTGSEVASATTSVGSEGPRARRRARAAEAETQARRIHRAAVLGVDPEPGPAS